MFILKTNNNLKSSEYYYLREKEEFSQPISIKEVKMGEALRWKEKRQRRF